MHIVRNVKIQEKLTQYSFLSYTRLLLFEYIFLPQQTVPAKDNMLSPIIRTKYIIIYDCD